MTKTIDELPEVLTAQHIASYLTISRRRVYELLQLNPNHGGIPSFNIGSSKRVMKDDFEKWIVSLKSMKEEQFAKKE